MSETPHEPPVTRESDGMRPDAEDLRAQAREAAALLRGLDAQLPRILASIPRATLAENLRLADRRAYARFFKGFRPQKIPRDRLVSFLRREAFEGGNDVLAHIVVVLWNEAHLRLYERCKSRLEEKYPKVEEIEKVDADFSRAVLTALIAEFGEVDTAILCKLNEVRFDREVLSAMLPGFDWSSHPQARPPETRPAATA